MSSEAAKRINSGRNRTNILRAPEFAAIEFLCRIMPRWVTSDMLSGIGFFGSTVAALSVFFASYNKLSLFVFPVGMAIQWFGDSLDGRLAYYRNTPRKWYGWLLDMNLDWLTTVMISISYLYFLREYPLVSFMFMASYGQTFILAIMRYKITDVYLIDADGPLGPTELRIILSLSTLAEYFIPGFLLYFGITAIVILTFINTTDFFKLVKLANARDKEENAKRAGL